MADGPGEEVDVLCDDEALSFSLVPLVEVIRKKFRRRLLTCPPEEPLAFFEEGIFGDRW